MNPDNKYTKMQQTIYDIESAMWSPSNRDPVVGSFDLHNTWSDYDTFLFKDLQTTNKVALDFGCGPGRCIAKFASRFARIDGADLSQGNLDNAFAWCKHNQVTFVPTLYKVNGIDLSGIPDNIYDIVYSTICLQHICVRDIRLNLMKEIHRVLKPGGSFCAQMGFGPRHPQSVDYYSNHYDAIGTNGGQDTRIEDTAHLENDLKDMNFHSFIFDIRPVGPGDGHNNWLWFKVTK